MYGINRDYHLKGEQEKKRIQYLEFQVRQNGVGSDALTAWARAAWLLWAAEGPGGWPSAMCDSHMKDRMCAKQGVIIGEGLVWTAS